MTLLVNLPRRPLLAALGVIVLAFGVRGALNLHGNKTLPPWWAGPAGLAGGTLGAVFGTGGPPYAIYLSHRLRDKGALRATFSGLFLIDGGIRVVAFAVAGLLFQPDLPWAPLATLPLMGLGLYLGHRVHLGISPTQMQRVIDLLLVASGTSLLWRSWS